MVCMCKTLHSEVGSLLLSLHRGLSLTSPQFSLFCRGVSHHGCWWARGIAVEVEEDDLVPSSVVPSSEVCVQIPTFCFHDAS
jgi:hypothetical protein